MASNCTLCSETHINHEGNDNRVFFNGYPLPSAPTAGAPAVFRPVAESMASWPKEPGRLAELVLASAIEERAS